MRIDAMNWMQVEDFLRRDNRCVLPLGSVEQHGYLSLAADKILAERMAVEAAEPLGIPVFPAVPYGLAPYFAAYPGSVTLRVETYARLVSELLDSIRLAGFRRVLIVNGHGGNQPASALAFEYCLDHPEMRIKFHNWWSAPKTWEAVMSSDRLAAHASWMENFPWTRVAGVVLPEGRKPAVDAERLRLLPPAGVRSYLGDGNYGGLYQRPDEEMLTIWGVAVEETRALLEGPWEP